MTTLLQYPHVMLQVHRQVRINTNIVYPPTFTVKLYGKTKVMNTVNFNAGDRETAVAHAKIWANELGLPMFTETVEIRETSSTSPPVLLEPETDFDS